MASAKVSLMFIIKLRFNLNNKLTVNEKDKLIEIKVKIGLQISEAETIVQHKISRLDQVHPVIWEAL